MSREYTHLRRLLHTTVDYGIEIRIQVLRDKLREERSCVRRDLAGLNNTCTSSSDGARLTSQQGFSQRPTPTAREDATYQRAKSEESRVVEGRNDKHDALGLLPNDGAHGCGGEVEGKLDVFGPFLDVVVRDDSFFHGRACVQSGDRGSAGV